MFRLTLSLALGLALQWLAPTSADAAWPNDPSNGNVALSTAAGDQIAAGIVSDGAGGAIVTWQDHRGTSGDIYAQRVSAAGAPMWTADGVALSTAPGLQLYPTIVSDGAGGAIVAWENYPSGIRAQRVSAAGMPQWTTNGVVISTAGDRPTIASDGAGGAIVTWEDAGGGPTYDIYAQRVSADGVPQWIANGVALSTAADNQIDPKIVSDGASGAIVTWQDLRSGTEYDIYAQRVNAAGVPQWTADGVALTTAVNDQGDPEIAADGAGGAIVTWEDSRSGDNDVYAQRVNAAGVPQWTADGVAVSTAAHGQVLPTILADGTGGAIVAWIDLRVTGVDDYDIYAQRVSAAGVPQWTADGVALSTAPDNQWSPTLAPDGADGAIVAWFDKRSGTNYDIYAQRVSAAGVPQWSADGVALSTAVNDQAAQTIVSDGAGGAIVAWQDRRSGANYDIYAQNINADGTLGGTVTTVPGEKPAVGIALAPPSPNPWRAGALTVRYTLGGDHDAVLELIDLAGRSIASRSVGPGAGEVRLDPPTRLPPGLYFLRLRQSGREARARVAITR